MPRRRPLLALLIVAAAAVVADARNRIATFEVAEDSMAPALRPGDYVLTVRDLPLRLGDVVVFPHPDRLAFDLIKRVAGLEGDVVRVRGEEHVVGEGEVYLLGDAPAHSVDSRWLGTVPIGSVTGRVILRYWPVPSLLSSAPR